MKRSWSSLSVSLRTARLVTPLWALPTSFPVNTRRNFSVANNHDNNEEAPLGFSWIKEGVIGGMAGPTSSKHLKFLAHRKVALVVTLTEEPLALKPEIVFAPNYAEQLKSRLAPKFLHLPIKIGRAHV